MSLAGHTVAVAGHCVCATGHWVALTDLVVTCGWLSTKTSWSSTSPSGDGPLGLKPPCLLIRNRAKVCPDKVLIGTEIDIAWLPAGRKPSYIFSDASHVISPLKSIHPWTIPPPPLTSTVKFTGWPGIRVGKETPFSSSLTFWSSPRALVSG